MLLFFCWFKAERSWLLSATSKADASARAKEQTGASPDLVVPYLGAVSLEFDDENDDGTLTPDGDTADILVGLFDAAEESMADTGAAPADCDSSADGDGGEVIPCVLGFHDGVHKGPNGESWGDE